MFRTLGGRGFSAAKKPGNESGIKGLGFGRGFSDTEGLLFGYRHVAFRIQARCFSDTFILWANIAKVPFCQMLFGYRHVFFVVVFGYRGVAFRMLFGYTHFVASRKQGLTKFGALKSAFRIHSFFGYCRCET